MERLALHIESLIFSSENTISLNQIKTCIEETLDQSYKNVEIKKAIDSLIEKYRSDDFSFEIVEIASGYKFLTKGSFHATVGTLIKKNNQKRLSKAALETLSIIAYKQNVTKSDVEGIRGVNCDYTIQKLLEKDLVTIKGRAEGPGRPLLYGTSDKFMDYFGIKDIDSLPKLQDLKVPEIQIGEPAPIEEDRAAPTNEANIDIEAEVESDDDNQAESISEENVEDKESDDDNQADSIAEVNIEDQNSDDGDQANSISQTKIEEDQQSEDDNRAESISAVNIEDEINEDDNQPESDASEEENQIARTNFYTESSPLNKIEVSAEVIKGEKPMADEEAHQALLNQEIVSSVDNAETSTEVMDSNKTSIVTDEEE